MTTRRPTHLDASGAARMVDVGAKRSTRRSATAGGIVRLPPACIDVLVAGEGRTAKGDVFQIARIAGIAAAKRTDALIPLCHQVPLDAVQVDLTLTGDAVSITAVARCQGRTGVEMEALVAVSVAALTVYDMLKAISHDIVIEQIELLAKDGGRSGRIRRRA